MVGRVGLEAVPEFGEQLVCEVAERGIVGVTGGSAAVIVGSDAGGFGQCGIGPPVASIAHAPVADPPCGDHPASPGGAGDRGGAGETAYGGSVGETVRVIAKLAEHSGAEDWTESGKAGDDWGLGVLVEHGGELGFERGDGLAHHGDDLNEPEGGNAQGMLDRSGLTQRLGLVG